MAAQLPQAELDEEFRRKIEDSVTLLNGVLTITGDASAREVIEALELALKNEFQLRTLIRLVTPAQPARGR